MSMDKTKRPKINKNIVAAVSIAAAILLTACAGFALWSGGEMRRIVVDQFSQEQLVVARNVSSLIERELNFLTREILLAGKDISQGPFDPEARYEGIQKNLIRVLQSGVRKIEIIDIKSRKTYIFTPHRPWYEKDIQLERLEALPRPESLDRKNVWTSRPRIKPSEIRLVLAVPLAGDCPRLLIFNVNVSWFLTPFLKKIRSGKTGYAWIIDGSGYFLYHPETVFIGKSCFKAREKRDSRISYGKINFIQKEKMLKGREGTGWYISGWHRGITGEIKKLIAYCPIVISDNPPQKWSAAIVAPVSEIEEAVHRGYLILLLLQGLAVIIIVLGAAGVLSIEMRWSRRLEWKVNRRTEELKRSEERYRSLVESAEDFIFTVDTEGKFQSMNSFTANFFGGHCEEFLGKDLSALFSEEVAENQLKLIELVYKLGKSVRDEFEIYTGEHRIWISANFMPLKNESGTVSAVLCIARDITESKSLERQLISTEKLASLGTLAAGVAHEINNPMGVILGFCDLLLREKEKGSQEYNDLKTIERQGYICKQVVENLLSFARLGEDKSEYSDLNLCLKEIIQVVKHTLEIKDIALFLSLADNIPLVKGDFRQLQQVFLNLINNASAAMPAGGTLAISSNLSTRSRKVVVQFEDNGIGIKKEDMDHIFEPFFTTKGEGEGTGLGLFVTYGIITKYGGTIECVSQRGNHRNKPGGTVFTVKLLTTT